MLPLARLSGAVLVTDAREAPLLRRNWRSDSIMNHFKTILEKLLKSVLTEFKINWLAAQVMYGLAGRKDKLAPCGAVTCLLVLVGGAK